MSHQSHLQQRRTKCTASDRRRAKRVVIKNNKQELRLEKRNK